MSGNFTRFAKKKKRFIKKKPITNQKEKEDYTSSDSDSYHSEEDEGRNAFKRGGYHPVKIGEIFNSRYRILTKLGVGHFSTVWLAADQKTNQTVALKVVKSASNYTAAAKDEIEILRKISQGDSASSKHVIQLIDHFEHKGINGTHICMATEALGNNLLELVKAYNYRGIPIPVVKSICRQILIGLDYIHRECNIIHTDLKLENVLLIQPLQFRRKVKNDSDASSDEESSKKLEEENIKLEKESKIELTIEKENIIELTVNGNGKSNEEKPQINSETDKEKEIDNEKEVTEKDSSPIENETKESLKLTKNQKKHLRKKIKKQQQKVQSNKAISTITTELASATLSESPKFQVIKDQLKEKQPEILVPLPTDSKTNESAVQPKSEKIVDGIVEKQEIKLNRDKENGKSDERGYYS